MAAAVARDTWCANGEVWAIAPTDSVVYMAGAFNFIGAPTGSFVVIDSTGEPVLPLQLAGGLLVLVGLWLVSRRAAAPREVATRGLHQEGRP